MGQFTRRTLLKTGLAFSAGQIAMQSSRADDASPLNQHETAELIEPAIDTAVNAALMSPRTRETLDFGWKFHLGNADDPTKDFTFGAPAVEATFAKAGQIVGHNNSQNGRVIQPPLDDSAWRTVDVPHDWAVELPFVPDIGQNVLQLAAHGWKPLGREFPDTSIGWYRRTFDVSPDDQRLRIFVEFDGVFRDAMVVFNGFYVGRNMSGYAPFGFDVTDYVMFDEPNVLELRVDATLGEGWFYEGAGIYRHTWLTKTAPLHIAKWGTYVRSDVRKNNAVLTVGVELVNKGDSRASGHIVSQIVDANGAIVASTKPRSIAIDPDETTIVESKCNLDNPELWSLGSPNLYRVVTQVMSNGAVVDHDDTSFGIRSIRFDPDHGFFLNDVAIKIKGTCNHQDHAGVGSAVPDRIHYERVAALKAMGSNAWRTAHNPVAPGLLDACDRLGMMVMSETRMMASTDEGLSELERMIKRDRNHPSIIIWSLSNEEHYQNTSIGYRVVSTMKKAAKKLDPTRPVTGAMNFGWGGGISQVVDVQGFNYFNNGNNSPRDIEAFHQQFPLLPCIGSETPNGSGTRGCYADDPNLGYSSVDHFAGPDSKRDAEVWWTMYDERPFLSGGFTWVGFDYRGEPGPYDSVSVSSQSGCLDTCGFPKDIYYYYKAWWGLDPVLYLFPHWNWPGKEGQNVGVRCHTNLDSVELFLNGKSLGSKTVVPNGHLYWDVAYEPGVLMANGYKNGRVVLTDSRTTTGAASLVVGRPSQTLLGADGKDVSSVTIEIQDSSGLVVPTAINHLTMSLSGPGKIIGVGNGNPGSHERDRPPDPTSAERDAFNGLALAIIQSTMFAGSITLNIAAEGLIPASVVITSSLA
jgi:beta-galactosidase